MSNLIAELKNEKELVVPHICEVCAENGFSAEIHPSIGSDNVLIIKVDSYYNSLKGKQSPSPDCLIIVQCEKGHYDLYIVELKNVVDKKDIDEENIRAKFNTCLHDYMSNLLKPYFGTDSIYEFGRIELHLVTNPFTNKKDSKANPLKFKLQLGKYSMRRYEFRGRTLGLILDAESPLIQAC